VDYVPPTSIGWRFHQDEDPAPTAWLIKYILPETGAGLIAGQWGTYKTTVALDIAVSVMTDTPFAGRYRIKRPGGVAYFALEGIGGLASRLTAIARTRGYTEPLPFVYRSDCAALTAADALGKLTTMIEHSASLLRGKFDVPLVLVFVDTVIVAADYSKSGDDNDAAIAQRIMAVLSQLSQQTGTRVVGIDHFGKVTDTGTRGSSVKEGHADTVLALLADRELNGTLSNTRLSVRKQREGISGLELAFTPTTVNVGTDPDGDPITRVAIDWAAPSEQSTAKSWSKSLQLLRRILMTLLIDGKNMTPFLDGPIVRACDVELVRTEFYRQYPAEGDACKKAETRRKAFGRVLKSAQDSSLIMLREIDGTQFVWLAKNETA
jgi:hypothetical protein